MIKSLKNLKVVSNYMELSSKGVSQKTWDSWNESERADYLKRVPNSKYANPNNTLPTTIIDINENKIKRFKVNQLYSVRFSGYVSATFMNLYCIKRTDKRIWFVNPSNIIDCMLERDELTIKKIQTYSNGDEYIEFKPRDCLETYMTLTPDMINEKEILSYKEQIKKIKAANLAQYL